jgi:hypothetical protein
VRAEGAIKFERWNDREGFQRTCLTVIASKVEKLAEPEAKPAWIFTGGRQRMPCGGKNLRSHVGRGALSLPPQYAQRGLGLTQ